MLDDIWYRVNDSIGFYTRQNFDRIPALPGIYAWYYPLRVTTRSLDHFLSDSHTVFEYDAEANAEASGSCEVNYSWTTHQVKLQSKPRRRQLSDHHKHAWQQAFVEQEDTDVLRAVLMKATLFTRPLYVGKTQNLARRAHQHITGETDVNSFNRRFTEYARVKDLSKQDVADLLFVCIPTPETTQINETPTGLEDLIEEIMKGLSRPPYSVR